MYLLLAREVSLDLARQKLADLHGDLDGVELAAHLEARQVRHGERDAVVLEEVVDHRDARVRIVDEPVRGRGSRVLGSRPV